MPKLPTVAVIGAGSSGIAAVKTLHQRGYEVTCFEKSDRVGGNWVFQNRNGMSSSYSTLHINTSRERMEYSDFPMPKSYPDFPHHTHIARYFEDYVDHFGFRPRIRFNTGVERAELDGDGTWTLSTDTGETHRFDALIVANGHHWDPRWPEPPFPGHDTTKIEQLHSHFYTDPSQLAGKDVVVLGMGNSAMDIAVDASYVAGSTYLAARRGAHIIPKYLFGKPVDQIGASPRIPFAVRRTIMTALLRLYQGEMTRYGLPKPDHKFGSAHPTVSGRILDRLAHGAITPKPNIARLEDEHVVFTDGTRVRADMVVYCTGYNVTFPFFDPGLISAPNNDLPLFRRVFHPEIRSVFFVGLLQPLGAIMPLAEAQSAWIADHLAGAKDVFGDLGFGAASVRDIVRRTPLASGTFYNYFPDKESIFRALVEDTAVEARRRVREARRRATTPRGFVEDSYRAYFEFIVEDPATFAFLARNAGTIRALFDDVAIPMGTAELAEDLAEAIERGRLPAMDVDYAAHAMIAVGVELGMRMIERHPPDVDGATRFATGLFLGGLQGLEQIS